MRQRASIHEKINTMMIGLSADCGGHVFATAASPTRGHAALPCATGAGRPRRAEVSPARAW
ncbi:hypothetical protein AB0L65_06205 [Nonomuraea sp. NPDC052116]|uniref:hypothetical protein n=1 Tax=Nonomuraea sp. NPDC052116 TaxID=3155665 RepID=UPI003446D8E0